MCCCAGRCERSEKKVAPRTRVRFDLYLSDRVDSFFELRRTIEPAEFLPRDALYCVFSFPPFSSASDDIDRAMTLAFGLVRVSLFSRLFIFIPVSFMFICDTHTFPRLVVFLSSSRSTQSALIKYTESRFFCLLNFKQQNERSSSLC